MEGMRHKYKLTYFNVSGLGEPIRYMLSYGGVDFEDYRLGNDEWPKVKPTTPFGKVPVLEVDGKKLFQCVAICRHLAQQFNIAGDDAWQALQIDMAVDTIGDFMKEISSCAFDRDAASKAAKKEVLLSSTLPSYLSTFDALVKTNGGFFADGKLSWADLFWTAMIGHLRNMMENADLAKSYPNLMAIEERVLALPAIKAWVAKTPKTN